MRIAAVIIAVFILMLSGCTKVKYDKLGIGRSIANKKATGYGKLTIYQAVDTAHYFSDNDIIRTEIWLGDKNEPMIFSFGSIIKECAPADTKNTLQSEYDLAFAQANQLRLKLVNGGLIITNDDNISDEENWLRFNKTADAAPDLKK